MRPTPEEEARTVRLNKLRESGLLRKEGEGRARSNEIVQSTPVEEEVNGEMTMSTDTSVEDQGFSLDELLEQICRPKTTEEQAVHEGQQKAWWTSPRGLIESAFLALEDLIGDLEDGRTRDHDVLKVAKYARDEIVSAMQSMSSRPDLLAILKEMEGPQSWH